MATVIIFSLNYLVYPTAFGGTLPVDSVTATGAMADAFIVLSIAGAVIIGLLMTLYLLAVRNSKKRPRPSEHAA